jgi:hypothetical protein
MTLGFRSGFKRRHVVSLGWNKPVEAVALRWPVTLSSRCLVTRKMGRVYFPIHLMNDQESISTARGEGNPGTVAQAGTVVRRPRCDQCGGPFGLIRRRKIGRQFCSVKCMAAHARAPNALEPRHRWYDILQRR